MICSRPSPFSRCSLPIHAASICAVPFTAWRGDPAVVGRRLLSRRTSADATRALSLGSEPRAIVTRTCRASASRGAGRALRSWRCEGGARGRAPPAGYPHLPRPRPYSATQPPVGAEAAVTADANKPHRLPRWTHGFGLQNGCRPVSYTHLRAHETDSYLV